MRRKLKKTYLAVLLFIPIFLFGGCGQNQNASKERSPKQSSTQTISISTQASESQSYSVETKQSFSSFADTSISETAVSVPIDLDITAISKGEFSTLAGTWRNGEGQTLVINNDGTTNDGSVIIPISDSGKDGHVPYADIRTGNIGALVGLYKIGFKNPKGDYSDTTKPRIVIIQEVWDYPAEEYYYRQ